MALRKLNLRISKVPHNGHWYSSLPFVRLVHLVRNAHEEGTWLLNIKSHSVVPVGGCRGCLQKYLNNQYSIFQWFFSRVKNNFPIAQITCNLNNSLQTAYKLISANSKEVGLVLEDPDQRLFSQFPENSPHFKGMGWRLKWHSFSEAAPLS